MIHHIIKAIIITSVIALCSCDKSIFDAGPSQTRELIIKDDFSRIIINKTFDITLVQDTINKIWITAGENLQPDISIYVKESILYLDNTIKYNWSRNYEKVKLEIHLVSIPVIQVMEPSLIITKDTFKTDHFHLEDWGKFSDVDVTIDVNSCAIDMSVDNFGRIVLKGKTVNANLSANGSCFIYADNLATQNCSIESQTIGDIYVNVSNTLTVSLNSNGNVYYYGQPVEQNILNQSSTGTLIKATSN